MDNETIRKAKAGEAQALESLYAETQQMVYFTALGIVKNEEDAQDIVQETYMKAFQNLFQLENEEAVHSWLKTIAVNSCKNHLKKKKPSLFRNDEEETLILESAEEIGEDFLPQEYLDQAEKRQMIKEMIDDLPDTQRTAVMLYYYDELSLSEVSNIMETSDGTTKSRLNYARKQIRTKVEEQEKKGIKLYTGVPMLTKILHLVSKNYNLPPEAAKHILSASLQAANISTGAASSSAASAAEATNQAAAAATPAKGILAKLAGMTVKARVIALISAAVVIAGGVGIVAAINQKQASDQAAVVLQQKQKAERDAKAKEEAKKQAAKKAAAKEAAVKKAEEQNSILLKKLRDTAWGDDANQPCFLTDIFFFNDGRFKLSINNKYEGIDEYLGTYQVKSDNEFSIDITSYTKKGVNQPFQKCSALFKVGSAWLDDLSKNQVLWEYPDAIPMSLTLEKGKAPFPENFKIGDMVYYYKFGLASYYDSNNTDSQASSSDTSSSSAQAVCSGTSSKTSDSHAVDYLGMTLKQLTDKYGSDYTNYGNYEGGAVIGYEDKRIPYRFGLESINLNSTDRITVVSAPDDTWADSTLKGGMTLSELKAVFGSSLQTPKEDPENDSYETAIDKSSYSIVYSWDDKSCSGHSWTRVYASK